MKLSKKLSPAVVKAPKPRPGRTGCRTPWYCFCACSRRASRAGMSSGAGPARARWASGQASPSRPRGPRPRPHWGGDGRARRTGGRGGGPQAGRREAHHPGRLHQGALHPWALAHQKAGRATRGRAGVGELYGRELRSVVAFDICAHQDAAPQGRHPAGHRQPRPGPASGRCSCTCAVEWEFVPVPSDGHQVQRLKVDNARIRYLARRRKSACVRRWTPASKSAGPAWGAPQRMARAAGTERPSAVAQPMPTPTT